MSGSGTAGVAGDGGVVDLGAEAGGGTHGLEAGTRLRSADSYFYRPEAG